MISIKRTLLPALTLVLAGLWWAEQSLAEQPTAAPSSSSSTAPPTAPGVGWTGHTAEGLDELLAQVQVIDDRPDVAGYDRDCGSESACVFGPAWTDDHSGLGGRNGCDTRNDVLRSALEDLEVRPGTNDCVIVGGTLGDPYTGQLITFVKSRASEVQIDHLYPLAAAWDMGAAQWTAERRIEFANDQELNLLAVDGSANASKGDRTPGEWMPVARASACEYLARYLQVAATYDLPITRADAVAVTAGRSTCPTAK